MNKDLLLEVRGRSLELLAYALENRTQEKIDEKLMAYYVRANREGISPKQQELEMKAIIKDGMDESLPRVLSATAKDIISNLKLSRDHLE